MLILSADFIIFNKFQHFYDILMYISSFLSNSNINFSILSVFNTFSIYIEIIQHF